MLSLKTFYLAFFLNFFQKSRKHLKEDKKSHKYNVVVCLGGPRRAGGASLCLRLRLPQGEGVRTVCSGHSLVSHTLIKSKCPKDELR
jgi:hypothetical protein